MAAVTEEKLNSSVSGCHQYKYWKHSGEGNRVAVSRSPCTGAAAYSELIEFVNLYTDGARPVYGVVFDFDAHGAEATHVVRCTGGQGLGFVLGLTPFPIFLETKGKQLSASKTPHCLLVEPSFGADRYAESAKDESFGRG